MIIVITGTPGTGKTSVAKELSKLLHCRVLNERDFALKHKIGKKDKSGELIVPLEKLKQKISLELKKYCKLNKQIILIEGHMLCEIPLNADLCVVLRAKPGIIEKRLKKRAYSDEKILENSFCEETGYCLEKAKKNYLYIKEIDSSGAVKSISKKIFSFL